MTPLPAVSRAAACGRHVIRPRRGGWNRDGS